MSNLSSEMARVQFGYAVTSHVTFPVITMGVATYLMIVGGLRLRNNNVVHTRLIANSAQIDSQWAS